MIYLEFAFVDSTDLVDDIVNVHIDDLLFQPVLKRGDVLVRLGKEQIVDFTESIDKLAHCFTGRDHFHRREIDSVEPYFTIIVQSLDFLRHRHKTACKQSNCCK